MWRPGFWIEYRPNWVWVPAHYRWTPLGYVFVDGYWDYPLATRGVLFAPVVFRAAGLRQPAFVYTPAYVVSEPCMVGALFVRRGYGGYYFGDYFDPRYATVGLHRVVRHRRPRGGVRHRLRRRPHVGLRPAVELLLGRATAAPPPWYDGVNDAVRGPLQRHRSPRRRARWCSRTRSSTRSPT